MNPALLKKRGLLRSVAWVLLMICLVDVKAANQDVRDMPAKKELDGAITLIEAAFSELPRKIGAIAVDNAIDGKELERDFRKHLAKARVPDSVLLKHRRGIRSLTPEAFALLLPQFLAYGMRNPTSEVADYVIYFLESAKIGDPYYDERLSRLSAEQLGAIDVGLRFFDMHYCANDSVLRQSIGTATQVLAGYRRQVKGRS